jgi:hypothetical protein
MHASLDEAKTLQWDVFCQLKKFPQFEPVSGLSFTRASLFLQKIRFLISHISTWMHARVVFDERIAKDRKSRVTQQTLAIRLLGPSAAPTQIARIEKHLIEKLSTVLVKRDFRFCRCFVDPELLEVFYKVKYVRTNVNGFEEFRIAIKSDFDRLGINEGGIPYMVWTIADERSPNSYQHLSRFQHKSVVDLDGGLSGKIKLTGFKSIY